MRGFAEAWWGICDGRLKICTILYYTILHYTILHYTTPYHTVSQVSGSQDGVSQESAIIWVKETGNASGAFHASEAKDSSGSMSDVVGGRDLASRRGRSDAAPWPRGGENGAAGTESSGGAPAPPADHFVFSVFLLRRSSLRIRTKHACCAASILHSRVILSMSRSLSFAFEPWLILQSCLKVLSMLPSTKSSEWACFERVQTSVCREANMHTLQMYPRAYAAITTSLIAIHILM